MLFRSDRRRNCLRMVHFYSGYGLPRLIGRNTPPKLEQNCPALLPTLQWLRSVRIHQRLAIYRDWCLSRWRAVGRKLKTWQVSAGFVLLMVVLWCALEALAPAAIGARDLASDRDCIAQMLRLLLRRGHGRHGVVGVDAHRVLPRGCVLYRRLVSPSSHPMRQHCTDR